MKVRKHFVFYGRVQAVGFRFTIDQIASQLGLTRWAKNQYDGTVEACVQGEPQLIQQLLNELKSDRFIRIDRIQEDDVDVLAHESSFEIHF